MNTDKFTLFVYCNFLVLLNTTVCSQYINNQNVNIADETLTDYSFLSRYHYTKSKNYLKRRYRISSLNSHVYWDTLCFIVIWKTISPKELNIPSVVRDPLRVYNSPCRWKLIYWSSFPICTNRSSLPPSVSNPQCMDQSVSEPDQTILRLKKRPVVLRYKIPSDSKACLAKWY